MSTLKVQGVDTIYSIEIPTVIYRQMFNISESEIDEFVKKNISLIVYMLVLSKTALSGIKYSNWGEPIEEMLNIYTTEEIKKQERFNNRILIEKKCYALDNNIQKIQDRLEELIRQRHELTKGLEAKFEQEDDKECVQLDLSGKIEPESEPMSQIDMHTLMCNALEEYIKNMNK